MSIPTSDQAIQMASEHIPSVHELLGAIDHPDKIDAVTRAMDMGPRLYNFHLATKVEADIVDAGTYVPVQISTREGGRQSLYLLDVGQEIVAGTLITKDAILDRIIRRDSGVNGPAKEGDLYTIRYVDMRGNEVAKRQYALHIVDAEHGIGTLGENTEVWILWSAIHVVRQAL